MVEYLQFVSDMTDEQVHALTDLLAMPPKYLLAGGVPAQEWLARQEEKMLRLPRELTKPTGLVDRTRIALAKKGLSTDKWLPRVSVLCTTHALLNPWVVHRVFLLLQHEVMHRVNTVRYYRGELKTQEVVDYCTHVSGILSLFKTPTEFAAICRTEYPGHLRFDRIASGCEACILAAVGSRAQLLVDLKASLLGRADRRKEPRLMRFVDRWMQCFGPENEGELLLASQRLGEQIRAINKSDAKRRREVRRLRKEKIAAVEAEKDDMERQLKKQRITASQLRMGLGEIDKNIERKYGKDWEKGRFHSTQSRPTSETPVVQQHREDQRHPEPQMSGALGDEREPQENAFDLEHDLGHHHEEIYFEQDERNLDHEQRLEQSIDDWYQRSVTAASKAPSNADPFDWSGSNHDFRDTRSFAAKSAVPSPLLVAKDTKDREVATASDAPAVPRIPSKYGVFENLTREEPYAPSSVYSSDEKGSTFTPSPASTPVVAPENRSSAVLPLTEQNVSSARNSAYSARTPLDSPARSPSRHSKRSHKSKSSKSASVSTLRLSEEQKEDNNSQPRFSDPWIPRFEPDDVPLRPTTTSVVSSAVSPGTRPASDEYRAMQAELEDAFSMVDRDDAVSDEIVHPDDSVSQVHPRPPTRMGTGKTTLRSVTASVRPARNTSKKSDSTKYLGLYRDE
ncbi:hypothetical protein UCRPA7_395 [Phaeoacremonium minimum UCRPA7]|uniref:Uncharacterized protein n=1 Tax=Phaeoacremonium minimum (strain UCR-PA7) TaxID=1286976 RepID=R8BXH0_PHAM7|nr:hypothetical protein UCRPA7_395 [Phaeoacremonium minimum UCRPA7]EOO04101.1 hypothetical protein UCRPA7_395 [Phaeoacremonium minimum UCRPA7]